MMGAGEMAGEKKKPPLKSSNQNISNLEKYQVI